MTALLALDLGTKTGYAFGNGEDSVVSGVANFSPKRFEGGGMRFLRFRRWLDEIHQATGFTEIHFEEVRNHKGVDAAHIYGGLMAHLTEWCESNEIPYSGHPVGSIKNFATGKGNANKDAVIAAVKSWGFEPADDNEADALAIYHMVAADQLLC